MSDEQMDVIINRILKAEADLKQGGKEYIERARIIRIIRGLEDEK